MTTETAPLNVPGGRTTSASARSQTEGPHSEAKGSRCPVTHRPYFMHLNHPEMGLVPTYGGPLDSYTAPVRDEDDEFRCERYDHDAGEWVDGGEPAGWWCREQPASPAQASFGDGKDLPSIEWPKGRDIGRIGDMSPTAHLRVGLDGDNDVYVSVWDEGGGASIEFCCPGSGGGKSSRTRVALIALMVAMEADNAETPRMDWWQQRMTGRKGSSKDE